MNAKQCLVVATVMLMSAGASADDVDGGAVIGGAIGGGVGAGVGSKVGGTTGAVIGGAIGGAAGAAVGSSGSGSSKERVVVKERVIVREIDDNHPPGHRRGKKKGWKKRD